MGSSDLCGCLKSFDDISDAFTLLIVGRHKELRKEDEGI